MKPMHLPWLQPGDPFPDPAEAWDQRQPAPGLLAAGGALDVESLQRAYARGIFPWFSEGQPILWWSTDPRMVLFTDGVQAAPVAAQDPGAASWRTRAASSLRQRLRRGDPGLRRQRAHRPVRAPGSCRHGARPTRLSPAPASPTAWRLDRRRAAGGLYCVALGAPVVRRIHVHPPDGRLQDRPGRPGGGSAGSRARADRLPAEHPHLASLGAREIPRADFVQHVAAQRAAALRQWRFDPVYWNALLPPPASA
jgi:leucyl/phenylalanyl-tRNA--protein transferase